MRRLALLCLMLAVFGCAKRQDTVAGRVITDLAGRTVKIPAQVQRISCVDVLAFQTLMVLGQTGKMVEMRLTNSPWMYQIEPALKSIPKITNVNIEEILNKKIDVVFTYNDPRELLKLEAVNVAAVIAQPAPGVWKNESRVEFVESQKAMVRLYGQILGDSATFRAGLWCAYCDSLVNAITTVTGTIPKEKRVRTFVVRGPDAMSTHGRFGYTTWYGEMAGADMVAGNTPTAALGGKTQVSMEELITWDPEIVFISRQYSPDLVLKDPRWRNISAVKNNRVIPRPEGVFYWDGGTEALLSLPFMAKTLYPDLFPDLNLTALVQDYYRRFYHYTLSDSEAGLLLEGRSPDGSRNNTFNN